MGVKVPIRTVFDGSTATGLAEYQSGEFIALAYGGLGASLSIGSAGQVLKVNSGASALEFGAVEAIVNIDNATDLTAITLVAGDQLLASDGGTEGRITLSQLDTLFSGTSKTLTNKTLTAPTITGTAVMATLDISGDVDVDGTLETDALTIGGTAIGSLYGVIAGSSSIVTTGALNSGSITSGFGTIDTGSSTITSTGAITGGSLVADDVTINGKVVTMTGSTDDTAVLTVATNGALTLETTDTAAAAANIQITADGTVDIDSAGVLTLDSGAAINIEPASGSAILLDGTISIDAGVVTGATSITSTAFVGDITGDVTGNTSGTAATVTTAAQTNITSLGTLTALTVDDIVVDGKVITMTGSSSDTAVFTAGTNGTLSIVTTDDAAAAANIQITADGTAELAGTTVTLDSSGGITLNADSGTITFADDGASLGTVTSAGFTGNVVGNISGGNLAVANGGTIGSASDADAITIATGGDVTFSQDIIVTGDLTVNGTTTTVNSTTVTIDDPIFTLGGDSAPGSDDNKDRGIEFRYHDGSNAKIGFFGWDDSTTSFTFLTAATNSSEVFSGTIGNLTAGVGVFASLDIEGNVDINGSLETDGLSLNSVTISATGTELNYVDGVTSAIQTQMDTKTTAAAALAAATAQAIALG